MIIRRATANDADAVLGCLRAAFAPYEKDYTPAAYVDTVQQRVEIGAVHPGLEVVQLIVVPPLVGRAAQEPRGSVVG